MKQYRAHCMSGYYQYERMVTVDKKLDSMPYAQAGIICKGNTVFLVSYETIVCEIDNEWLHCYGTFSQSTRKHIGAFLKECAPNLNYYHAKDCYLNDIEININTGEIRPASLGTIQTIGYKIS